MYCTAHLPLPRAGNSCPMLDFPGADDPDPIMQLHGAATKKA